MLQFQSSTTMQPMADPQELARPPITEAFVIFASLPMPALMLINCAHLSTICATHILSTKRGKILSQSFESRAGSYCHPSPGN